MTLRDCVILASGKSGAYVRFICKKGRFQNATNVVIIPFYKDMIMLSRQYSHTDRKWVWQTPRGFGEYGLNAEQNALKELNEEVGFVAKEFIRVFESDDDNAIFMARMDNQHELLPSTDEGEISQIRWISLSNLKPLILSGEVTDSFVVRLFVYLSEYGFPG